MGKSEKEHCSEFESKQQENVSVLVLLYINPYNVPLNKYSLKIVINMRQFYTRYKNNHISLNSMFDQHWLITPNYLNIQICSINKFKLN